MNKIKVAVLYGGKSPEHEVSISSARSVLEHIDREKFIPVPIWINQQGQWFFKAIDHDLDERKLEPVLMRHWQTYFDIVFPVLHGPGGEDGTLQGFLETLGMPYVGCGLLGSAIGINKGLAKKLVHAAGISIVPFIELYQGDSIDPPNIVKQLGLPLIIKPCSQGSSIGVTWVADIEKIQEAVQYAFSFGRSILIEQGLINKREISVAILETHPGAQGSQCIVSQLAEVCYASDFLSYKQKYFLEDIPSVHIPAQLTEVETLQAQALALKIFRLLYGKSLSRIDFFYSPESKQFIFNEVNTLPGFTEHSLYPQLIQETGMSYSDLLTHLIEFSLNYVGASKC